MADLTIKLPEKVYVGFNSRPSQDEVPLGFMTPWGTDQAAAKRMATVDRWAKGYNPAAPLDPVTLDNIAMTGFKIGRSVTRRSRWSGSSTMVRIEDPRGFELEISVDNLTSLMANNITQNGEIIQECIWGRSGKDNVLLAVNSQPYVDATANTARSEAKVNSRDVKPGFDVTTKSGLRGIYLGKVYVTCMTTVNGCIHDELVFGILIEDGERNRVELTTSKPQFSYIHSNVEWDVATIDKKMVECHSKDYSHDCLGSYQKRPKGLITLVSASKPSFNHQYIPVTDELFVKIKSTASTYDIGDRRFMISRHGADVYAVLVDSLVQDTVSIWTDRANESKKYVNTSYSAFATPFDGPPSTTIDGHPAASGCFMAARACVNEEGIYRISSSASLRFLRRHRTIDVNAQVENGHIGLLSTNAPLEILKVDVKVGAEVTTCYPMIDGQYV